MIINYQELGFQRINFDTMNPIRNKYNVKQSDTMSRGFYVQILQAGELIPPNNENVLSLYGRKPDGTEVFVNAEIRGDEYVITLPNQVFAQVGTVETELTLQGPNLEKITIKGPDINVLATYSTNAIESSNDFSALTQALSQLASFMGELEDVQLYAQNLSELIGNTEELDTVAKENLVLAINELVLRMEEFMTPEEVESYLTDKVDNITLGDMMLLLTQENETVVGAINELKADLEDVRAATSAEELIGIFTSKADKTMIGDLGTLATAAKTNVVEAINEIYNAISELYQGLDVEAVNNLISLKVGDTTLLPNGNPDVVSAIIEINSALSEIQSVTDVASLTALISGKADKSQLNALVTTVANKADSAVIGVLGNLLTTDKTNLVNAINEVKSSIDNFNGGLTEEDVLVITDSKVDEEAFLTEIGRIDGELLNKLEMADVEGMIGGGNGGTISDDYPENVTTEKMHQVNVSQESSIRSKEQSQYYEVMINGEWVLPRTLVEGDYFNEYEYIDEHSNYPNVIAKYSPSLNQLIRIEDVEMGMGPGDEIAVEVRRVTVYTPTPGQINASNIASIGENARDCQINSSSVSNIGNDVDGYNSAQSQINASSQATINGFQNQINAAQSGTIKGSNSQINASRDGDISGMLGQINASTKGSVTSTMGQINSSEYSKVSARSASVNSSKAVENKTEYTTAYGYGTGYAPLSANVKVLIQSKTGEIKSAGTFKSGQAFTDYAELFPNLTSAPQEPGLIQTVDSIGKFGYGVRPANEGEGVVGVVSAMAGVILGDTPFSWQGRWLKDEWGAYIMEDIEVETGELDEEGNPIMQTITLPKENPDFNPDMEFKTREERPEEWTVVGMVGQVYVRLKEDVQALDYVKPWLNGVGQKSVEATNIRVMKITQPYNAEKGYAIGFCLLK